MLLTKTDETNDEKIASKLLEYAKFNKNFSAIMPVNIKKNIFRQRILNEICKYLPEHPYYYDTEILSSTNVREIYRDLILQGVFESVNSEIPYCTDVLVDKVVENSGLTSIFATIITDSEAHKKILVGKGGETIKRIGIRARKLILNFSKVKIYIKLSVSVKKSWIFNENLIKAKIIY